MRIYLIRHLKTRGNYERRYIGRTDESLSEANHQTIIKNISSVQALFSSPMKRCLETAKLLLPEFQPTVVKDLREIDFGDFENKTYEELKGNPDYIRFLDSNGTGIVPNGETVPDFKRRCCDAFLQITELMESRQQTLAAIVCHGGTIMAILEAFHTGGKSFYDYQVKNGEGYEAEFDLEHKKIIEIKELKA